MKLKVLELFGGIGSPRKALENIGIDIKHIDYVEVWNHAVLAYNQLFKKQYDPQSVIGWNLNVDLLIHGSPCQDFSIAGKNDLSTGRSILYLETLKIIEERLNPRPKFVIWENVKGLISKKNFPHFQHYLDTMESFGYENHYQVLNSKDFGIPQSRNRIFVVSIRKDIKSDFDFNNLTTTPYRPLKDFLDKEVDPSYYIKQDSMKKAIEQGKIKIVDNVCGTITTKQWRWNNAGVIKIPISKDFTNFITLPRESDGEVINGSHNRYWKADKYVGTLTASAKTKIAEPLKNLIPDIPVFIIDEKPYYLRVLTERECWRLMGWKDKDIDKVINMPKTHLYHMAGNAIVIQVLEAIFKELFKNNI